MARKDITQIYGENPKTYDQFTDQDYFYFATGGTDAATTLAELRKKMQGIDYEPFTATITADKNKNIGSYNLASGDLTISMAVIGHVYGVIVTFKIIADGVHAVHIGNGFDDDGLIGISEGQILAAGTYIVRLRYEADGAIIELPSNVGGGDYDALSSTVDGHTTELSNKVDKVTGKVLSTNDFDATYKSKLDNAPTNTNTSLSFKADLVGGKVPSNQLPDISESQYLGGWNAATNTPSVSDAVGTNGQFYIVETGGTRNLGSGNKTFVAGGKAYHNGTIWEPKDPVDAVVSVAGKTGAVALTKADVGLSAAENKSSAQIRSEIVESNIPVEIPRFGDIPIALSELNEDATHRSVTDAEKAQWNAGGGIISGGTETQNTTWSFATHDISNISLTGNLQVTGVVAFEGVGEKLVQHNGFTLSVLGVTGFTNRNGEYLVKVTNFGTTAAPKYRAFDGWPGGGIASADPNPVSSNITISGKTQNSLIYNIQSDLAGIIYAAAWTSGAAGPVYITDIMNGNGAIAGSANNVHTNGGITEAVGISNLANGAAYDIYSVIISDAYGTNSGIIGPTTDSTVPVDNQAPVLTGATITNITDDGCTLNIASVSEACTIYMGVWANGTGPADENALIAGAGAIAMADPLSSLGGSAALGVAGLNAATPYDQWYTSRDAAGNITTMAKLDFSTVAVGVAAVWSSHTNYASSYFPYLKRLPANYNPALAYPIIFFYHGLGEAGPLSGAELSEILTVGLPQELNAGRVDTNAIVVCPQSWSPYYNQTDQATRLKGHFDFCLNEVSFGHKVDANKVGITGLSMGAVACGVMLNDTVYRSRIAWAAPMGLTYDIDDVGPLNPENWSDVHIWWFMGTADSYGNAKIAEAQYYCLQQSNPVSTPRITLFTGLGHFPAVWNDTWNGVNYDKPVSNTTWLSTPINSTAYNAANDLMTWAMSKSKGTGDIISPVQQTPTSSNVTNNAARGTFQSNENGTVYAAVYPSADALHTRAEIQAGTGAVAFISGGLAVTAGVNATHDFTGLSGSTNYKIQSVAIDASNNQSNILASAQFTTAANDTTAPTISAVSLDGATETTMSGHATINETGTVYVALTLASASPPLTSAQIIAGTDGSIISAQNSAAAAGVAEDFSFTGLTASTAYKLQVTARDSVPNTVVTPTVSSNLSTSTPAATDRWLINFGGDVSGVNPTAGGTGWNDWFISAAVSTAATLSNLVKSNGDASAVDISIANGGYRDRSPDGGQITGNNSGAYKDSVIDSYWWGNNDTPMVFTISSLQANTQYRVRIMSDRTATGTRNTRMTVLGQTAVIQNAVNNTSTPHAWVTFTTDGSGVSPTISVVRNTSGDTYSYLNVMEFELV